MNMENKNFSMSITSEDITDKEFTIPYKFFSSPEKAEKETKSCFVKSAQICIIV